MPGKSVMISISGIEGKIYRPCLYLRIKHAPVYAEEVCMKKSFYVYLLCVMYVSLPFMLWGCSQTTIPLAAAPPLFEQYKLQSADHWHTVAEGVASRVQKTLEDRPDLIGKPVYVAVPNDGVFIRAFGSMLRSRLVSKGMQVSEFQESDSLVLNYSVQTVLHDSGRGDYGLGLSSLGIAIASPFVGGYTTTSDHEVIINTSMVHRNRYAMSLSQVCYIHDADWRLYFDPVMLRREGESADAIWQRYAGRGQAFGSGSIAPRVIERPRESVEFRGDIMRNSDQQSFQSGGFQSSMAGSGASGMTPVVEVYQMRPGGRMIDPAAAPTPIGLRGR